MALIVRDTSKTFEVCDADLVDGGDKETFYEIRPLTREVIIAIDKKHTTTEFNKRTRQPEQKVDEKSALEDKLDYLLVSWRGVIFENGDAVPCSLENKLACIGGARQVELFRLADVNRVDKEARAASFRESPAVDGVLGR